MTSINQEWGEGIESRTAGCLYAKGKHSFSKDTFIFSKITVRVRLYTFDNEDETFMRYICGIRRIAKETVSREGGKDEFMMEEVRFECFM